MIYTYTSDGNGFDTHNFFYDNGEEVVVFDTQFTPAIAEAAIAYLRTKTQNPITHVVITHPNPDKFNAMSVYQAAGAKVVASKNTVDAMQGVHDYKKYYFVNIAKMFTEETYPPLGKVDTVFEKHHNLKLGNGEDIILTELSNPGVSSTQTVAFIAGSKALMVGDLVHNKAHAWLEGGIVGGKPVFTLAGWITDLEELKTIAGNDASINVYGGRGELTTLDAAVSEQIAYLEKADGIVMSYIENLGARKSELTGPEAGTHYAALQTAFEKAFPDYKLPYMIGYSIYGMVNSKL